MTWNATTRTVTWTQRVIAINLNYSLASNGFFDIGPTTITFNNNWTALYYVPTNGMSSTFDSTKLTQVSFPADIGENWIFICSFNSDTLCLRWNPGYIVIPNGGTYTSSTGVCSWNINTGDLVGTSLNVGSTGLVTCGNIRIGNTTIADPGGTLATQNFVTSQGYLTSGSGTNPTFGAITSSSLTVGSTGLVTCGNIRIGNTTIADPGGALATQNFVTSQGYLTNSTTGGLNIQGQSGSTTNNTGKYYILSIGSNSVNSASTNTYTGTFVGLICRYLVQTGTGFIVNSDQRIKKNIQSLSPEESLQLVQSLKPVSFDYIDPTKRTTKKYGFIAQEVESVLPTVINHSSDYIPNIFELVQKDISNKNKIRLTTKTTDIFELPKDKTQKIKLKFYDASNNEILREIQEIVDDKTILLSEPITEDPLFLYGQEVPDFRSVEHEQINTVLLSAVQAQQKKIESLESKIDFLMSKISP